MVANNDYICVIFRYRVFPDVDLNSPCMGTFMVVDNDYICVIFRYRVFPEVDLNSPCMGTYLVADNEGIISVGDPVYAEF